MAILDIQMRSSEKITAESGAMVYMKGDIEIQIGTREGGFLKKIKVTALGGESFFVNDYIAHGDCSIGLTGPPLGDIVRLDVDSGSGFIVQSGSYVASTQGVTLDTQWQGFHLVALSNQATYRVTKVGGTKTMILGGEGLATEITGPGSLYFQTKNIREFIRMLEKEDHDSVLRYAENYLGYKKAYLMERKWQAEGGDAKPRTG